MSDKDSQSNVDDQGDQGNVIDDTQQSKNSDQESQTQAAEQPTEQEQTTVESTPDQPAEKTVEQQPVDQKKEEAKPVSKQKSESDFDISKLGILSDVYLSVSIEVGRAKIKIRDLLNLNKGSIVELDKLAGEPVDLYVNGKLISTGSIVATNGKYCIRIATINKSEAMGTNNDGK